MKKTSNYMWWSFQTCV